jgi:hypothetical protein
MPSGIYPVPKFDSEPGGTRPGLALRIRTRWAHRRLDEQLAQGADPAESEALRLRSAQLRSPKERSRIAGALVELVGDAGRLEPAGRNSSPDRVDVLRHGEDILALAERLRDEQPVDVRGVAMTARLVDDGGSPLRSGGEGDLQEAIQAALTALDRPGLANAA